VKKQPDNYPGDLRSLYLMASWRAEPPHQAACQLFPPWAQPKRYIKIYTGRAKYDIISHEMILFVG